MTNSISNTFGGNQFSKSWYQLKNYKPETRSKEDVENQIFSKAEKLREGYENQ